MRTGFESAQCKECLLRQAAERLREGLIVLDRRGKVRFANEASARLLGVSERALVANPRSVFARAGADAAWDTAIRSADASPDLPPPGNPSPNGNRRDHPHRVQVGWRERPALRYSGSSETRGRQQPCRGTLTPRPGRVAFARGRAPRKRPLPTPRRPDSTRNEDDGTARPWLLEPGDRFRPPRQCFDRPKPPEEPLPKTGTILTRTGSRSGGGGDERPGSLRSTLKMQSAPNHLSWPRLV